MNFLSEVGHFINHVGSTGEWVVLVCPSNGVASDCARVLAATVPEDSVFSGRTAMFPKKGRISVCAVLEDMFLPTGTAFTVAFVGWSPGDENHGMEKWSQGAQRVLQIEAQA